MALHQIHFPAIGLLSLLLFISGNDGGLYGLLRTKSGFNPNKFFSD
jgi:hypothetical protein